MKEIQLSNCGKNKGKYVALVDNEDYERVNQFKWHILKGKYTFYAARSVKINDKKTTQTLHKFILNTEQNSGKVTDHIDHNGLNNQKYNICSCLYSQNNINKIPKIKSKSIYKGIYYHKINKKFIARLNFNGKCVFHKSFKTEIEAAKSYDIVAKKYYGDFAYLNFHD